jgi:Uma2 family endonuclease
MTVAARHIHPDAWSLERFLEWAESQPEGVHYEFDGVRPMEMPTMTVGHNRISQNIHETVRGRLPAGPCRPYGLRQAISTVGGAIREPDAFIACSSPRDNDVIVPGPVAVFEVMSPGRESRRRDEEEKADEYNSVPSILRYVVADSERRWFRVFWREPGERAWHREPHGTDGAIHLPEFGVTLTLDEVYAGVEFD